MIGILKRRRVLRRQAHRNYTHDTSVLVNLSWTRAESITIAALAHRTGMCAADLGMSLSRLTARGWAVKAMTPFPRRGGGYEYVPTWHLTDAGCSEAERRCGW